MSALETIYGSQFNLSTQWIKPIESMQIIQCLKEAVKQPIDQAVHLQKSWFLASEPFV